MGSRAEKVLRLDATGRGNESAGEAPRTPRFGAFEVDLCAGELRRNGLKVKLQEQPLQVLTLLLERPGEVVSRDDLRNRLWPADTFVDSMGVVTHITYGNTPYYTNWPQTLKFLQFRCQALCLRFRVSLFLRPHFRCDLRE